MAGKDDNVSNRLEPEMPTAHLSFFAIMPISDHSEFAAEQFNKIYEQIIAPATETCRYVPIMAVKLRLQI